MRLANKVAIISGGGSGIGRASSCLFAREGARVVIAQRSQSSGEETVAAIKADGGQAVFVPTDVSQASDIKRLIEITKDRFGKIDILFNNAGMFMKRTLVENIEESLWDSIFAVNVKAVFLATKYVVPEMRNAGGGVIISTGSMSGFSPRRFSCPYTSAKGALITLTKALALELARDNIRVNCINPSDTASPPLQRAPENFRKEIDRHAPFGRIAEPEDIAHAALYLASDEASMLTGTCLNFPVPSLWMDDTISRSEEAKRQA